MTPHQDPPASGPRPERARGGGRPSTPFYCACAREFRGSRPNGRRCSISRCGRTSLLGRQGKKCQDAILYVDTSDVREGAVEELKPAVARLVELVEVNEPRIITYNVYFSEDGTRMTVVSLHPDTASVGVPPGRSRADVSSICRARHAVLDPHLRRAERGGNAAVA